MGSEMCIRDRSCLILVKCIMDDADTKHDGVVRVERFASDAQLDAARVRASFVTTLLARQRCSRVECETASSDVLTMADVVNPSASPMAMRHAMDAGWAWPCTPSCLGRVDARRDAHGPESGRRSADDGVESKR